MLTRGFRRLVVRFLATDPGLSRLRFASAALLSAAIAVPVLYLLGVSTAALTVGSAAAITTSTSLDPAGPRLRWIQLGCFVPVMVVGAGLAALPLPTGWHYAALLALMFLAVWVRRWPPLGMGLGMGAFMAFFFASLTGATPADLPDIGLAVVVAVASAGFVGLVVLPETPARSLARTVRSVRAQLLRVVDELAGSLSGNDPAPPDAGLPPTLAQQVARLHESTLQIGDTGELLCLPLEWRHRLVDAELAVDRLCRATVRARAADIDGDALAVVLDDFDRLRVFLTRDPNEAPQVDVDGVLRRIAGHDLPGGPAQLPSTPEHYTMLLRRAIWDLVFSVVQVARAGDPDRIGIRRPDEPAGPADEAVPRGGPERPWRIGRRIDPVTRSAVQCAVGGALALAGGHLVAGQRWHWAVFTAFLVFVNITSRGDLLVKGGRRLLGTAAGVSIATVLATLVVDLPVVNAVILAMCVFLAFYTLRVSYAVMTFFITIMTGMVYDLTNAFSVDLMLVRLLETLIGVGAATLAVLLVFPAGSRTRVTAVARLHEYFTALHDRLGDTEAVLVRGERIPDLSDTRDLARAAAEVRRAFGPLTHRLSRSQWRRGPAELVTTLTARSALAAGHLTAAADPGALAGVPRAADTLRRLIGNTAALARATAGRTGAAVDLVSGPAIGPTADLTGVAGAVGTADMVRLRRVIGALDRLDLVLLGLAEPLGRSVIVAEPGPGWLGVPVPEQRPD